jgi:hypothetical protein
MWHKTQADKKQFNHSLLNYWCRFAAEIWLEHKFGKGGEIQFPTARLRPQPDVHGTANTRTDAVSNHWLGQLLLHYSFTCARIIPTLLHWRSVHFLPCIAVSGLGIGATTAHVSDVMYHVKDMRSVALKTKQIMTISRAWRMGWEQTALLLSLMWCWIYLLHVLASSYSKLHSLTDVKA